VEVLTDLQTYSFLPLLLWEVERIPSVAAAGLEVWTAKGTEPRGILLHRQEFYKGSD